MEIHIITSLGVDHILSIVDGVVVIIPPAVKAVQPKPDAPVEPTPE
jgi:hypothetical protein